MKTILLSIILINLNAISQNNLPDYNEILLSDERLNLPLIDKMLELEHQVSDEAVVGDWQVLGGRINFTYPDEADNSTMEFDAWKEIVMTFEESGYYFLDGIIDVEGDWELQSNNTVLLINKQIGKRVDAEYRRIFIDGDIMHLIIKEENATTYMVLQKTEKRDFMDIVIENIQATVQSYYLNISLYYECLLKDVFQPQLADIEFKELLKSIQKTASDCKTLIETYEIEKDLLDKFDEVNKILALEEELLNTLIAFNKNRSEELKKQFEQERSTVWKAVSGIGD